MIAPRWEVKVTGLPGHVEVIGLDEEDVREAVALLFQVRDLQSEAFAASPRG